MDLKHTCKFCKKTFPCGRSLGGHIRSHLIKDNKNSSESPNKKPKFSESGFEPGTKPRSNSKKTNKTKLKSSPSSFSTRSEPECGFDTIKSSNKQNNLMGRSIVNGGNSSTSSVSETEHDDVAIAMCLIMLSRDVGIDRVNSSYTDNQFCDQILLIQANNNTNRRRKREKNKVMCSVSSARIINKKSKNLESKPFGSSHNGSELKGVEVSETLAKPCESKEVEGKLQNGPKMKEIKVLQNGVALIDQNDPFLQSKRKVCDVYEDGFGLNDQKSDKYDSNLVENGMNLESFDKDFHNKKRSKFECTTCSKVFNSYQALGGHRASHKRVLELKSSLLPKLEFDVQNHHDRQQFVAKVGTGSSATISSSKKLNQRHECPICFRVFQSGQALGGHKRSHLLSTNGDVNVSNETNFIDKSSSPKKTRDLFDLNLPPTSIEDETTTTTIATPTSSHIVVELVKPCWWIDSSNNEQCLDLIVN